MKNIFPLLFIIFYFFACGGMSEPINDDDPADLQIQVDNVNDGSGLVKITATSKYTTEFHFYMGEDAMADPIMKSEGQLDYSYSKLGSYNIEVRAYGKSGRYIKKEKQIFVVIGNVNTVGEGYVTPIEYEGMTFVWADEFDGEGLNALNWNFDIGTGCPNLCGWGNNELEYYRSQNVSQSGGLLTIEAKKEDFEGSEYTSGRIKSRGLQNFTYGRVDIRALLPKGQGIWPALWMLGSNQPSVGWPECGEIDIMEMIGGQGRENTVYGNMFWNEQGPVDQLGSYTLDAGTFNDEFHVFSIIWDEQNITWLVNDNPFHQVNITDEKKDAFHNPFFFLMNVAVGGYWPGIPDQTTTFPVQMHVDYIRVFQKN